MLQDFDDLLGDVIDERAGRRPARGDGRSGAEHAVQVTLLPAGAGLLATPPQRHLGHRGADDHEQHGCLDVRPVGDGEGVVGLGQEEVEPRGARHGRHDSGRPDAGGAGSDDQENQDECGVGVRHAVAERRQHRAGHQWHDNGGPDNQRPVRLQGRRRCACHHQTPTRRRGDKAGRPFDETLPLCIYGPDNAAFDGSWQLPNFVKTQRVAPGVHDGPPDPQNPPWADCESACETLLIVAGDNSRGSSSCGADRVAPAAAGAADRAEPAWPHR